MPSSYFTLFSLQVPKYKNKLAIADLEISYLDLYTTSIQFILGLQSQINVGDTLFVCCEKSLTYIIAAFACDYLNLVFVPYSFESPQKKKADFLKELQAKFVVDHHFIEQTSINKIDGFVPKNIVIDEQVQAIFQTSGTTGKSKGACFSKVAVNANIQNNIQNLQINENDIMWSYGGHHLPAFIFTFSISTLVSGGSLLLSPLAPLDSPSFIKKHRPSITYLPPASITMLHRFSIIWDHLDLSSLRTAVVAGDSAPDSIPQLLFDKGIQSVYHAYGSTDACMATPLLEHWVYNTDTPYIMSFDIKACQGWEYTIAQDGELLTRGIGQMKHYLNRPDLTQEVYKNDWFHTGDIVEYRDTPELGKRLFFVSRKKDIIKVMNNVVSPLEVERVINQVEEVSESAVFGIPDAYIGEKIIACVVLKNEAKAELITKKIKYLCNSLLDSYAIPKKIEILEKLPKTNTGHTLKIQKSILKAKYL